MNIIMHKQNLDLITLYAKAVVLANKRHDGQTRKVNGEPFVTHPLRVSEIVLQNFKEHQEVETMRLVAVLHDLLEDTNTTEQELEQIFGKKVSEMVKALSENKSLPTRKESYAEYLGRLIIAEDSVKIIKLCDIQDNLSTIDDNVYWKAFLERSKQTLEKLNLRDERMNKKYSKIKEKLLQKIIKELEKRK